jgi:GTPase
MSTEQNFVDYVKIHCKSGAGGAGSSHFHRDKVSAKGGPDGGDGGKGGGNGQLWTLLHLKFRKHVIAESGKPGTGTLCTGADGEDVILDVPLGTVAKDAETGEVLFEITKENEEYILMPGGRGGWGNNHFKSPTNQTPTLCTTW